MPLKARAVFWSVVLIVPLPCSDPSEPGRVVGSYTLREVNGLPLPYFEIRSAPNYTEIIAGRFNLNADLTYEIETVKRITSGSQVTTSSTVDRSTYTISGSEITLVPTPYQEEPSRLTVSGNTLTLELKGRWVYRR